MRECDAFPRRDFGKSCDDGERFPIWELSRPPVPLRPGFPHYYDPALLILKRLSVPDSELKASESLEICGTHKACLLENYPFGEECVVCRKITQVIPLFPEDQDRLGGSALAGESLCSSCKSGIESKTPRDHDEIIPPGQIWVTLDESYTIINSSVPSLRLLCRGILSQRALRSPPELTVKDAVEIRRSLVNVANVQTKDRLGDRLVSLGITPHYSEFRATSEACERILQILTDASRTGMRDKISRFSACRLSNLVFFPDESKSGRTNLEHYIFLKGPGGACGIFCLACNRQDCSGCLRPLYPCQISLGNSNTRHWHYLQSTCRCCKKRVSTYHIHPRKETSCSSNLCKFNYAEGFRRLCFVDIFTEDNYDVHPQVVCGGCRTYLASATSPATSGFPEFYPHTDDGLCDCELKLFYADAKVVETEDSLKVVVDFSRIPSLMYSANLAIASVSKSWTKCNMTIKTALEIYNTLLNTYNRKIPDSFEFYKSLALKGIIRYPVKGAFHNKTKAFQTVLTMLCESLTSCLPDKRKVLRTKLDIILSAEYYGTEPVLRNVRKVVKFWRNQSIVVMCVSCPDLNCNGGCGKPSPESAHKKSKKPTNEKFKQIFRLYGKKLNLGRDITHKEYRNYKLTGIFVPEEDINPLCVNCRVRECVGCKVSGSFQRENLQFKLGLQRLPTKKELSYYVITGKFVLESDLTLINSKKTKSGITRPVRSSSSSSNSKFLSRCPDCKYYFRKEYAYLKHLESCYPGALSITCSHCQKEFKSEMGYVKHICVSNIRIDKNMAGKLILDLEVMDFDSLKSFLLNNPLPGTWTASSGPYKDSVEAKRRKSGESAVVSRYKDSPAVVEIYGSGAEYFKSEVWATVRNVPGVSGEFIMNCVGCNAQEFPSRAEFARHKLCCEKYILATKPWQCGACHQRFFYETAYVKHMSKCKLLNLPDDLRLIVPDEDGRISCPGCNRKFVEMGQCYIKHLNACKKVKFRKFPCKKCRVKFSTKNTFLSHDCGTSNKKRRSSTVPYLAKRLKQDVKLPPYEPICKIGDYQCPICGLKFILNQPYGSHVKNTECVESGPSQAEYCQDELRKLPLSFASIKINYRNVEGSVLRITYSRVPSLRFLCRGFFSDNRLIKGSSIPPMSVKDAVEFSQSLEKSLSATNEIDKDKLWKSVKKTVNDSFGDYESFLDGVFLSRETFARLLDGAKSASPLSTERSLWFSKLKSYIFTPFHDQFRASSSMERYRVVEYPSTHELDRYSMIQLLCLRCFDVCCIGCKGDFSKDSSKTISQIDYYNQFREWKEMDELLEECRKIGKERNLRRIASIEELIQVKKEIKNDKENGVENHNDMGEEEKCSPEVPSCKEEEKNLVSQESDPMPWMLDEECILPD